MMVFVMLLFVLVFLFVVVACLALCCAQPRLQLLVRSCFFVCVWFVDLWFVLHLGSAQPSLRLRFRYWFCCVLFVG